MGVAIAVFSLGVSHAVDLWLYSNTRLVVLMGSVVISTIAGSVLFVMSAQRVFMSLYLLGAATAVGSSRAHLVEFILAHLSLLWFIALGGVLITAGVAFTACEIFVRRKSGA